MILISIDSPHYFPHHFIKMLKQDLQKKFIRLFYTFLYNIVTHI